MVIAPPGSDHGELLNLIRAAKSLSLRVSVLPRMLEVVGSAVEFDDVDGLGVLGCPSLRSTPCVEPAVKRGTDLVGSALPAAAPGAPAGGACGGDQDRQAAGPPFSGSCVSAAMGGSFEMLKFRTMVEGADRRKAELRARSTRRTDCSRSRTTRV